jgi:hypothetical protein
MNFEIPVYCPQCKAIYRSGLVLDETSRIGVGAGNMFTCPKGHLAELTEGPFDARDGVLRVRDAHGVSAPAWQKIHDVASQALSGEITQDDAIEAITLLAPDLGPMLRLSKGKGFFAVLAIVLWFVVQMMGKSNSEVSPIFIENRQTSVGQVTINENIASPTTLAQRDRSAQQEDRQRSKRKQRRMAGKEKGRRDHR